MAPERKVWKVLFVDDEEGIRKVMEITLADAGYLVLTAPDGETALSLCAKESPQITITDIRMPGMDGIEVLRRIKEQDPNKEVIVVTAYGEIEIAIRALQLDASDFITKPINTDALLIALGQGQGPLHHAKGAAGLHLHPGREVDEHGRGAGEDFQFPKESHRQFHRRDPWLRQGWSGRHLQQKPRTHARLFQGRGGSHHAFLAAVRAGGGGEIQ